MLAHSGKLRHALGEMPSRSFWPPALALLAITVMLGTLGFFRFLWVFPLDATGLALWMLIVAADVLLLELGQLPARALLWSAGLFYYTARAGVPFVGVALVFGAAALWLAWKRGVRLLPVALVLAVPIFLVGHDSALLNPGMTARLGDWRFSCHLLASFAFFRAISWGVAVKLRGAKPSFLLTMEYFLAPAFWLSPMHAAHLLFDHMEDTAGKAPPSSRHPKALGWILRGFAYALVFSVLVTFAMPYLEARFRAGISSFRWWEWVLVGPFLFAASYLEKARVSYVAAGTLALSGHDVEPDFRSPWLARDLLDYWRRFHYWLWEYYIDLIYMPLATWLGWRMPARAASFLALFLTFTVGTSLIHWVHYPAPFLTALWLGFLFGVASVLHGLLAPHLRNARVGIPVTWLTVFVLYFLAYPAYGLGWGLPEVLAFFRR